LEHEVGEGADCSKQQNIGQILRENNMKAYDEHLRLLKMKGGAVRTIIISKRLSD